MTTDRITLGNLQARALQINRVLAEIGVDIDAGISRSGNYTTS